MHKNTTNIKSKLQKYESIEERIDLLKNLYKDETAYLITCGPSLTTHDQQVLKDKLKDKLVICAKQSLNYLNDICDFHLVSRASSAEARCLAAVIPGSYEARWLAAVNALAARAAVRIQHVRGHAGVQGNERADELCTEAMTSGTPSPAPYTLEYGGAKSGIEAAQAVVNFGR